MLRFGRYNLSEISIKRIVSALKTRGEEIPHTIAWNFDPTARENLERLKKFQGKHKGERCFIVANGPSLLKTDLDLLKNEVAFGMNRIYLHFNDSSFRPAYYVAVNELVLEQFSGEISQLDMPKFLNWNQRACFDVHDPKCVFVKSKLVLQDSFQENLSKPLAFGGTVTFVALQIAYYMGFQKVYLVGLDHQYVEKGTPNKTETRVSERDASHFNPNYFPKGIKWQLPDLLRSENAYAIARNAYERDGREILDATLGGHCEVFKKVDYYSLF
jgi:hypothetical protein